MFRKILNVLFSKFKLPIWLLEAVGSNSVEFEESLQTQIVVDELVFHFLCRRVFQWQSEHFHRSYPDCWYFAGEFADLMMDSVVEDWFRCSNRYKEEGKIVYKSAIISFVKNSKLKFILWKIIRFLPLEVSGKIFKVNFVFFASRSINDFIAA